MKSILSIAFLLFPVLASSQQYSVRGNQGGKIRLIAGTSAVYGLSVLGMNELWYKNYERSSFHWIDDSGEWLQIDKTGHFLSTYVISRSLSAGFQSVGMGHRNSVLWASGIAMLGISTIEVFDGFSAGWGASGSDLIANASGAILFAMQDLAWKEEKIIPKISWHSTKYASFRPDLLGHTFPERLLKDYNGHSLWLSCNLKSFSGIEYLPSWLCLSMGYGAEGMTSGYDDPSMQPYFERYRQYYLSFDADFSKINTRNKTINKILYHLNFIKIPFPALVFGSSGITVHGMYF